MLGIKNPINNLKRKKCMIYPNDSCKLWWDVTISIILLISTFTTPLDFAFSEISSEYPNFIIFNQALDCFFLLDILVTFNSAIQDEYFNIIDKRNTIAKSYLRSWFIIDFVSIIPFNLLISNNQ